MNCNHCARQTLSLFIRSFTHVEPLFARRQHTLRTPQQSSQFHSNDRQNTRPPRSSPRTHDTRPSTQYSNPFASSKPPPRTPDALDALDALAEDPDAPIDTTPQPPDWRAQKAALKAKLNGEAWNPRKKLSPDTMEGIRHLNATQPSKFTTPVLAEHFKVSPEAIRRILKGKWRPNDEEYEDRMRRWDKRGERIWSNLVEMGVKPPKKWREMGVGRVSGGERPAWKGKRHLGADVGESVGGERWADLASEDRGVEALIPIVDGKGRRERTVVLPLSQRI
ncbi:hypothetical protein T440DRAFT_449526 [Plenodomus tracheiphilus IPT5]|uniref:Required for respiratory growth protein 9, mitochondrial n=1 Tax=Plenodomus tracheiphilus IPT5 TaxID=1408161 RepID=A0A6A7B601_9PLEO|nr:hypothetical protein T440DRAFT_449526 [Plenodomus tracheiphilus IPT5]